MESDAILCISCGYDTRTRKKVEQASTSSIEVQAEQGSEKHSVVRDGRGSVILSVESSGWFSKTAREIDITGSTIFTDCGPGEMYTVEIMLPGRKLLARMMFDDSQLMREYISMITSAGHIPVDRGPAPNYF